MDLTPGTRIGPYEIVSLLGVGGMGEVYRATDTHLRRSVALKVLPVAFAGDLRRLARFRREAEFLAALNHPNIAAIYGLERSGLVIALVMEMVEGEDLSRVIARGPMPVDDALRIAKQIAEALEAAHERGIVHRDLKPGNVKLRPDGTIKVLDFGLAKAMDPPSSSDEPPLNPGTVASAPMTVHGTVLGTSGYMAPEQAQGRPVDRRADLWAFGTVLFEMLTGRRAFSGDDSPDIVTPATDDPASFALSPDGRHIVYSASVDGSLRLWLRSFGATTPQPLAGTEGGRYPFWAPEGGSIGYFTDSALKRFDLGGGAPQTVAPASSGAGGTWMADGSIVFAPSPSSPLMRVPARGGPAVPVTTFGPQQIGHRWPDRLPDEQRFVFYAGGSEDIAGIYLGSLDGSTPRRLTPAQNAGVYHPDGWLLWVRTGALVAQRLDVTRATLTGELITLAGGVAVDTAERSAVSVAATGEVAYRTSAASQRQLAWFDRSGKPLGLVGEPDPTWGRPRVSPDGAHVVVARTVQGNQDLWMLDGARATRFTFDAATDDISIWSPDGTRIVFTSTRTGGGDLYEKLASGAEMEHLLVQSPDVKTPSSWSADGRFVLFHSTDPQTSSDLWAVEAGEHTAGRAGEGPARSPYVLLKSPAREIWGAISPDGRWMAYMSNESGRPEIYIRAFAPPGATPSGGQWQVSTSGGIHPVWRPDGRELYYLDPVGAMVAAPIVIRGDSVEPGSPMVLFATRILGGGIDAGQGRQYDLARDGRFLINTVLEDVDTPITLLQHWKPR